MELTSRHKIYFKPNLYLMMKAISTVDGIGQMLDPDLQLIKVAEPFMKKVKADRLRPRRILEETEHTAEEYMHFIRGLPGELRTILEQVREGRMKIEFEHVGLDKLRAALDQSSNRISFAIVLAALVIGSSVVLLSGIPPKWHDIPIIGLVGFLMAGLMGFWLSLSILRHGKL